MKQRFGWCQQNKKSKVQQLAAVSIQIFCGIPFSTDIEIGCVGSCFSHHICSKGFSILFYNPNTSICVCIYTCGCDLQVNATCVHFCEVGFIYLEKYVTIFTWKGNTSIQVNVLPFHHGVFFVSQILNLFRVTKLSANSQQFRVSHC